MVEKEIKIFLTLIFIYLFFVQWYGWNEQSNLSLIRAIVEEQRFEIDSYSNQTGDRSFYEDHYYTDKNPGLSFLSSPIYLTWGSLYNLFPQDFKQKYSGDNRFIVELQNDVVPIFTYLDPGFFNLTSMILLTLFSSAVFSALTAVLIYKISKKITNEKYSLVVAFAYGVGTIDFISALHFMAEAVATFFSFLSFFILFTEKRKKFFGLAGIFAGFAIVVEHLNFFVALPLLFYAFYKNKKISTIFLLGLIIGVTPLLIYNFLNFNNPFSLSLAYIDRSIFTTAQSNTLSLSESNFEKKFVEASFDLGKVLEFFNLRPNPNPYVMLRLLFYPYRGLFVYSPILLLSLFGLIFMLKKYKAELALILFILFSFLFVISMRSSWWGGYCFGPIYLLSVIPFLTFPLAFVFNKFGLKLLPVLLLSILIVSLGLQPAEEDIYDWDTMSVKNESSINTFQVLLNPIEYQYIPNFLKYGPRSWVFESLTNGFISIDIRVYPISKGNNFPFSKFFVPFLCLIPVFIASILIWLRDIIKVVKKGRR